VPSSPINFRTPFQALSDAVVALTVLNLPPHIFGCVAFVHLHKHQCNKLTPRALRCVFLGYATHQKGYRCYHPPTRRMFITMDVVFHEDSMYFSPKPELQGENQKEIQTLDYDVLNYNHNSEESKSPESGNLDVGNLDQSGITLDSSGDVSQAGPINHEMGELDLSGMSLDTSGDESLEAEDVAPLSESNPCIIPNQSSATNVPDIVS